MQIACPQCSMQYEIDPRLLPPAGTSVQCTRCGFVFTAMPHSQPPGLRPAQGASPGVGAGSGSPPPRPASPSMTQVFGALPPGLRASTAALGSTAMAPPVATEPHASASGAGAGGVLSPAASKTQVFGALPPLAASPATTQVFGAATAQQAPAPATTQVFGAAAQAPAPTATQAFGAVLPPTPSPATTQAFGAASVQVPAPSMTQVFGAIGVAAAPAPSVELPGEGTSVPTGPAFPSRSESPEAGMLGASLPSRRSASVELPPELLMSSRPPSASVARQPMPGTQRRDRALFALAVVGVLGLTASLTYPAWRNRAPELPPEAVSSKDEALALLRRDDVSSREQAIARLSTLASKYPKFTEAQAELVVALSLQFDDVRVDLERIRQEEARLRREISALELAKSSADWSSRVNARKEELAALGRERQPLDAIVADLTRQVSESFEVVRAAPEAEPAADVVVRVKAQAVHSGVMASPQALALAERLRKLENPPHWSAISRAEYALNANSPPNTLEEIAQALEEVREADPTFLRAYVLGARIALRRQDPSAARALLDAVVAFNPNHTLARKLQALAAAP